MHELCAYMHEMSSVSACGQPRCIYSLFIPMIVKSDFHPNARLSPFQLNRLISMLTFKLTRWFKTTHSFLAYTRIQVRPNICQIHSFQPPQPLKPEYRVGVRDTCSRRVGRGIFRLRAWDAGCTVGLGSVRYIWRTSVQQALEKPYCTTTSSSTGVCGRGRVLACVRMGMCVGGHHMGVVGLKRKHVCIPCLSFSNFYSRL